MLKNILQRRAMVSLAKRRQVCCPDSSGRFLLPIRGQQQHDTSSFNSSYNSNSHYYFSTYYDSQSGMHVAIHNENEVSAFVSLPNATDSWEGIHALMEEKNLRGGVLLPPITPEEEVVADPSIQKKILELHKKKNDFELIVPYSLLSDLGEKKDLSKLQSDNLTLLFEYCPDKGGELLTKEILAACAPQKQQQSSSSSTAILCRSDSSGADFVGLANGVAQVLDDTLGVHLNKYLYVLGDDSSGDGIVELCEELSYVDAPGPTMKSRIIVDWGAKADSEDEETLEECLLMGINKFVIQHEEVDRLDWLGKMVQDQGKTCTFLF